MTFKTAIVLGSTRGIGRALVKRLAAELGRDSQVYLTARSDEDGQRVVAELGAEGVAVDYRIFDLADPAAPARLAAELKQRHGGVDIVVQNGAAMPTPGAPAATDARAMVEANSHGTLRVLRAFLPILRANGRIVVVASSLGVLAQLPESLRGRFDTTRGDPDAINAAMDDYVASVEAGTAQAQGWPAWVNVPSKVGQVAATRAFARQVLRNGQLPPGALINIANPSVTLTDATRGFMGSVFRPEDAQTPDEAAVSLAWLATLAPGASAPYGELVEHRRVIPFGD
ncbi:SDR family NAD(P)-dependent oxidoreductase [Burkholderiaceae bacterium UC74_6]